MERESMNSPETEAFFDALESSLSSSGDERNVSSNKAVYFVEAIGTSLVKIGVSAYPRWRLSSLQTNAPFELKVLLTIPHPHAVQLERMLHRHFAKHRTHGEWFNLSKDVIALLRLLGEFILLPRQAIHEESSAIIDEAYSIERRICLVLYRAAQAMTIHEILLTMNEPRLSYPKIRKLLSALAKDGNIERVWRGTYRCVNDPSK